MSQEIKVQKNICPFTKRNGGFETTMGYSSGNVRCRKKPVTLHKCKFYTYMQKIAIRIPYFRPQTIK
jgi:hypothetical protein